MAFVQCKDQKEQEAHAEKHSPCFMTEDFRVYKTIRFSDNDSYIEIDADTMMALTDLHGNLQFVENDALETSFTDLVNIAKDLKEQYLKTLSLIRAKPARKIDK